MTIELQEYLIERLNREDVLSVTSLYQRVREAAPFGYLASRDIHQFEQLLAHPESVIAVGARFGGELIAYSLCRLSETNPYDSNPVLDRLFRCGGPIYSGMGTVVSPAHEGKLLMARMLKLRAEMLKERSARNVIGLVDVRNLPSLVSILRSGGILVGYQRDETSLNYVAAGAGVDSGIGIEPGNHDRLVDVSNLGEQAGLFADGLVAFEMKRLPDGSRCLRFCKPDIL